MSRRKFESMLKPCPYCGGKGEVKSRRAREKFTVSYSRKVDTVEVSIRCRKCHARTQSKRLLENCLIEWNAGNVYPSQEAGISFELYQDRSFLS